MPMLIQNAGFDDKLSDIELNATQATEFMQNGVADYNLSSVVLPEDYRLVISTKKHTYEGQPCKKIRLIYTGDNGPEIVYAVNLIIGDHVISGKHVTQVMVWRSDSEKHEDAILLGFARHMFNHFVDEYVVIISDTEQTEQGRGLWISRINQSIDAGMFVYFVDLNELNDDLVPILNPIHDRKQFKSVWIDHGWGKDEEYKDRLFVISKENLLA